MHAAKRLQDGGTSGRANNLTARLLETGQPMAVWFCILQIAATNFCEFLRLNGWLVHQFEVRN